MRRLFKLISLILITIIVVIGIKFIFTSMDKTINELGEKWTISIDEKVLKIYFDGEYSSSVYSDKKFVMLAFRYKSKDEQTVRNMFTWQDIDRLPYDLDQKLNDIGIIFETMTPEELAEENFPEKENTTFWFNSKNGESITIFFDEGRDKVYIIEELNK